MTLSFNFMLITNQSDISSYAENCGISRIFIDLEKLGKQDRQGHLDTVISNHQASDIKIVKKSLVKSELLVRVNPFNFESLNEINTAIKFGADIIMLPMFRTMDELEKCIGFINGRCKFIPLIETKESYINAKNIINTSGVDEVYFGLNDLHRELGHSFMFEPLIDERFEEYADIANDSNIPFGFGGIARLDEGRLSSNLILAEHIRLGSSSAILSRSFHGRSTSLKDLNSKLNLKNEIERLQNYISKLKLRSKSEVEDDRLALRSIIMSLI